VTPLDAHRIAHAEDRLWTLRRLVGNTPLLVIACRVRGRVRTVYAKCEQFNLTGSIKDRMALHIMERAYRESRLAPGDTIVEATSGNTGISFAAIGRALGHPVTIFMPDWLSRERRDLMASFGATMVPVSADEGGFVGCIRRAEEMAAKDARVFLPAQFSNDTNPDAHETSTGREILEQLALSGRVPDAFVAGVGTGGTVMGVGRRLRARNPAVRIHPVEPAESPTLSTGRKNGRHRIQGISDEFIPPVVKLHDLHAIVPVHDGDAIVMAQMLARDLGLGVGISSGANFIAALAVQDDMPDGAIVVTVFPDSNKKYLSTCLLTAEPVRPGFISGETQLLGFSALPRVCSGCIDYQASGDKRLRMW
jgi:cysteine synthase A